MAVKEVRDFLENGNIKNSVNFPNCMVGKVRYILFHLAAVQRLNQRILVNQKVMRAFW